MAAVIKKFTRRYFGDGAYPVFLSALLSVAISLQVLIIVATVFSFIPIKLDSSLDHVLPQVLALFRPEREMFFYQFFVALTVGLQAVWVVVLKDRWQDEALFRKIGRFLVVEYLWIALEIFAVFKILVYKGPVWAKALFYSALFLSVASKVFWPEVQVWGGRIYGVLLRLSKDRRFILGLDILFSASVFVILWLPDVPAALGKIFERDQWFDLDSFLLSPVYARSLGETLNTDVFSPLGAGTVTLIAWLAKAAGGVDDVHVVNVVVLVSIVYFIACYWSLRLWFRSVLIAAAGTLMLVKLVLFNSGLIWASPQFTPLRFLLDLFPIYFIWSFDRHARQRDLWLAAAACGLSTALVWDTGVNQTLAFYAYLCATAFLPQTRSRIISGVQDVRKILMMCVLPWASMMLYSFVLTGPTVFTKSWWFGQAEFLNGLWQGMGNTPIFTALYTREFFVFFMALAVPIVFLAIAGGIVSGSYLRKIPLKNSWIMFVCFYGLAAYGYYVHRSLPPAFYVYSTPLVIVLCYGVRLLVDSMSLERRRLVLLGVMVFSLGALMTNTQFVNYPNMVNMSRHDWSKERDLYHSASNFEKDVDLIRGLTKDGEKAAVLGSFSAKILIDAHRRPYFYYSPVIISAPMGENLFKGTALYTKDRMLKILEQLEKDPPEHVFVERKIFDLKIPAGYEPSLQSWLALKDHLTAHYDLFAEGQYLVALKRKP